jgi:hypothetical protein
MTDLKVLQEQADKWLADATNAETFAKGAELLKSIDEQKKLRAEEQKLIADAEKAKVDAENGRRFWTTKVSSLAPMFAAIITGLTFGLAYIGQQRQSNLASEQGEEKAWREALQKVDTTNPASEQAGAFAMESFFGSQYSTQAQQVAAVLAPDLHNRAAFDFLFGELAKSTTQSTQGGLIDVARAISTRLRDTYNFTPETDRGEASFAQFLDWPGVINPTNDKLISEKLQPSESDVWELETISDNLSRLWKRADHPLDPSTLDLRNVIFLGSDFRGIKSLAAAEMDSTTGFYGQCMVDDIVKARGKRDNVVVECSPP